MTTPQESDVTASRNEFSRQCREWASSLDNAILRLNFKSKRGDDDVDEHPICCKKCGASDRVRFGIRTKDGAKWRRKAWKGRKKTNNDRGGAKKALLGRCEVCSHVAETLDLKERTRSSSSSIASVAPETPISDPPVERKSNNKSAIEDSSTKKKKKNTSGRTRSRLAPKTPISDPSVERKSSNNKSAIADSSKKKKKKKKNGKEEFAGLNLSKKPTSSSSQPLKAGDKKLLQMLRKNPASALNCDDRLSAFLRK